MFRCKSKIPSLGILKKDGIRNHWRFIHNAVPEQCNPKVSLCTAHFTKENVGEYNISDTRLKCLANHNVPG